MIDKATKLRGVQIKNLVQLQTIDSELWAIQEARGNLPFTVSNFEKNLETLHDKKEKSTSRLQEYNKALANQKALGKEAKALVKEYETKQKEARNDQELKIIGRDLDLEKLNVILAQKKVKEFYAKIEEEETHIAEIDDEAKRYEEILAEKKEELNKVDQNTKGKLEELQGKRVKLIKSLDVILYNMYNDRCQHFRKVVVDVVNDACGGCFIVLPKQLQIDVEFCKKVLTCENCSRILAYVQVSEKPEKKKRNSRTRSSASSASESAQKG
jgi:hypothetical protein